MKKKAKIQLLKAISYKTPLITKYQGTLELEEKNFDPKYMDPLNCTAHHLYIIDDSEIKEGDWYYWPATKTVQRLKLTELERELGKSLSKDCKKIIATTDPELRVECDGCKGKGVGEDGRCCTKGCGGFTVKRLPQIPQSFIESYCNNPIEKVLVEYEEYAVGNYGISLGGEPDIDIRLKVNSHNEITVHPIKDSWTRDEVETLIRKYQDDHGAMGGASTFVSNWIEENL